jgi:hypothetical protein
LAYVLTQRELGVILLGEDAGGVQGKQLLQDAAAQFRLATMMVEVVGNRRGINISDFEVKQLVVFCG